MEPQNNKILVLGMILVAFSCVSLWSERADAQEGKYPNKPIDVIINFSPGGTNDIGTRILADDLAKELGTSFSIQ